MEKSRILLTEYILLIFEKEYTECILNYNYIF